MLDKSGNSCTVVCRGCVLDGKYVERGGPAHPDDSILSRFVIDKLDCQSFVRPSPVRDTFIDVLANRCDLYGNFDFRHKPNGDSERRLFAAAFDAGQKIRSKTTVLGYDKIVFMLVPSVFAVIDCFARDNASFWIMAADIGEQIPFAQTLPLSAYVLEHGGYIPATATIRLGVWSLLPTGAKFSEVPNDRAAARDLVIDNLLKTPF